MTVEDEFFTILTKVGQAKIAAAVANSDTIKLHSLAVGDGGGSVYVPDETQTALRHELWRGELNELRVDVVNPNWITVTAVLPADVGGWYVREGALFDTDGDLIAIAKLPVTYKPLLEMGSSKQLYIQIIMEVTNAAAVTLLVDGSVVLATREYVDNRINNISFSTVKDVPVATLTQQGITQLSNATDSSSETQAATPKALKAAMDNANSRAPAGHGHKWNEISEVPDATLEQKGIVKLNSSTNSTITTEAATPSAVKAAMDSANSAQKTANNAINQANSAINQANGAINQTTADARYLTGVRVFNTNGVFTVPAGVTSVYVEMIGGGGGGGGGEVFQNTGKSLTTHFFYLNGAMGGGKAAPVFSTLAVFPGDNIPVFVGSGGSAGLAKPLNGLHATDGGDGGNSSFNNITASGGKGGRVYYIDGLVPSFNVEWKVVTDGGFSEYAYVPDINGNGDDSTHGYGGKSGYAIDRINNIPGENGGGYGAGGGGGYQDLGRQRVGTAGGRGSNGIVIISW